MKLKLESNKVFAVYYSYDTLYYIANGLMGCTRHRYKFYCRQTHLDLKNFFFFFFFFFFGKLPLFEVECLNLRDTDVKGCTRWFKYDRDKL
jgi:hypothetical protein